MKSHNSRHHIIPRSRGGGDGDNIAYVPDKLHNLYHQLFENRTPYEIVNYLNHSFWNGKYSDLEEIVERESFK